MELLKKLDKEGADLNAIDYLGRGVLHVVANCQGKEDIVKYLVKQQVNLDLLDNKARSALYLAIEGNNFKVA